jgi:hypothetical protein
MVFWVIITPGRICSLLNVSEECPACTFRATKLGSGSCQSNLEDEKYPSYRKVARTEANQSYGKERRANVVPC